MVKISVNQFYLIYLWIIEGKVVAATMPKKPVGPAKGAAQKKQESSSEDSSSDSEDEEPPKVL